MGGALEKKCIVPLSDVRLSFSACNYVRSRPKRQCAFSTSLNKEGDDIGPSKMSSRLYRHPDLMNSDFEFFDEETVVLPP